MSALTRALPRLRTATAVVQQAARQQLRCYASYPPHTVIGMPALSPTMTKGNLAVWSKKVGDKLEPGQVIAEIETDKAQMEFEFQEDGYLAKILVEEGTKDIPVGKPIAVYVEDEGDVAAFKDFTAEESAPAKKETENTGEKEGEKDSASSSSDKASKPAKKTESSSPATKAPTGRIFASPLAKTIALDKGISLKQVTGTGPNGRITKSDVEEFLSKAPKAASGASANAGTPATVSSSYEDVPISNMRRIIGERLLESTQGTPSYIVSSQISVSKLLKLRQSLNATGKDEYKLSVNDMLIKAITVAARRVPDANAYWLQNEGVVRKFKNVDVSVAVATPAGLLTPIVKNAESKGLVSISKEVKDLGKRAKANKLMPEEFQGGTICISNMGMNDAVSMFTSIINPPQSTILAIGTVQRVPVEDAGAEYGFSFDDKMNITGTFDHRTIDGAKAGEFMRELKKVVENPLQMLL
ncbi:LAMI_0C08636g1_1 [Lachancea mirantina]|uniref:Acetyltransferase component of pyruvate dehydrogenase complex n=1 Tax=Lachancea mirantina TaxID=1230905 RepID=A0A1G4J500_9SACH|nr:LAMI_0C08636g1_1 [Lachancea mirantina]